MKPITNIHQMKTSKFLKKEDVGNGMLVTIKGFDQQNVAMDDQPEEQKFVLYFFEDINPMVLNWTNIQLCAKATGTENPQEWNGKKIVLFNDPNVSFGGKLIGGIRIREVRGKAAEHEPSKLDNLDDVPF
jgi:hypothetical protein